MDVKEIGEQLDPILIGPVNSPGEALSISLGWYTFRSDEEGNRKMQPLQPQDYNSVDNPVPRFVIQLGNLPKMSFPLEPSNFRSKLDEIDSVFVSTNGLDKAKGIDLAHLWDGVALRSLENEVLNSLRIIAPGVEGLNFLGDTTSLGISISIIGDIPSRGRIPIVRIKDIDEPLPLRSLGDGMQRMLGIILALVNSKDGMVLIDEIENGIHYSAQKELWQLIFQLAHRLNIQVFATTHSWDCIEGFQKAATENTDEEGMLIRLSLLGDDVITTLFDERKLAIATREDIEVR